MASPPAYAPVLSSEATSMLIGLSRSKQQKMIDLLFRLAEHPSQPGDYSTRSEGRDIQHLRLGDFRVSFWADHAVRELRVIDLAKF